MQGLWRLTSSDLLQDSPTFVSTFFPDMRLSSLGASSFFLFSSSFLSASHTPGHALLKPLCAVLPSNLFQHYFAFLTYRSLPGCPWMCTLHYLLFTFVLFHIPFTVSSFSYVETLFLLFSPVTIRKHFFSVRLTGNGHPRLPRKVVVSPSLGCHPALLALVALLEQGDGPSDFQSSFPPQPFWDAEIALVVFEASSKLLPFCSKSREESQYSLCGLTRVAQLHLLALRELGWDTDLLSGWDLGNWTVWVQSHNFTALHMDLFLPPVKQQLLWVTLVFKGSDL